MSHEFPLPTAPRRGQSLVLLGHVRHALRVQVLDEGFHRSTEGMLPILYAVLFQQPQHALNIRCASDIHGIFGQLIHGGEIACHLNFAQNSGGSKRIK
jgi:hypothetical protein